MSISKKFDDLLTSPWVLWGISIAVAIFMWFYVMDLGNVGNERRKFISRIEFRNLDPQFHLRSSSNEATIEIEATETIMGRIQHDSIVSVVDVKGFSAGKYREPVRVSLPPNVYLIERTPSEVDIELIRQAVRVFPVEFVLPQDIPNGQYLDSFTIIPKEVSIRGTERDLAKIGKVTITPTLSELEAGKELLLTVNMLQSEAFEDSDTVRMEPQRVRVNAVLARGQPRRKVPVNVRLSGKPSLDFAIHSLTTDPAEVMVEGPANKLGALSAVETETVDISNLSADRTLIVPLKPLKDKSFSVIETKSVKLSIKLEPIAAQKQISGVPVTIHGGSGAKWKLNPAIADVTIEASPSQMELLDAEELGLSVHVDVANLFLKSATLPVRATVSDDRFKIIKIDPSTVNISAAGESPAGR